MKTQIKLTLSALIAATILGSSAAYAGASANVGVASNYIWRGATQTNDNAAISGGLDYDFGNGFSAGTWTSNLSDGNGYELDLYAGYSGKIGASDLGVTLTNYRYPTIDDADFTELGASLGFGAATVGVAYTIDSDDNKTPEFSKGDIYYSLGASTDIKEGLSLGGTIGKYDFDDKAGTDYTHYQLNLSKGDFTFAIDDNDLDNTDPRVSVAWAHSLDL
jgi:uncharacterized protein (TIGR02001 family)